MSEWDHETIDPSFAAVQHAPMADLPTIANNPDVRFLGKLLGDVIRAYGGEALFKRTEYIRSASVDRHRGVGGDVDLGLDRVCKRGIRSCPHSQAARQHSR